ncbi:uncharacterized protein PHALS_10606 [Plasmopara halstedii]|uniref:Uncharacterized protein n=1 Tax=Plasmopara halstedii TaxID=4781 RepID=A0A0P1AGR7_PLAHL|nr:uncharacterized protein PHALS_10606 [Plasmopara halstedii]CEG40404.1 hypothetical protein PHALS_10606 [Plasmopara halstedii]|eukprot:XP_024576773.1 hypothetical protein PHALS_10606 [Plasmopara halstedii]
MRARQTARLEQHVDEQRQHEAESPAQPMQTKTKASPKSDGNEGGNSSPYTELSDDHMPAEDHEEEELPSSRFAEANKFYESVTAPTPPTSTRTATTPASQISAVSEFKPKESENFPDSIKHFHGELYSITLKEAVVSSRRTQSVQKCDRQVALHAFSIRETCMRGTGQSRCIAATFEDMVGYPPPALLLHWSLSTPVVGPQAMRQSFSFDSAPSRASGGSQPPIFGLRHGSQQEVANVAPTVYQYSDSRAISQGAVAHHGVGVPAQSSPHGSGQFRLGVSAYSVVDSGVVDGVFVGATLANEGRNDAC